MQWDDQCVPVKEEERFKIINQIKILPDLISCTSSILTCPPIFFFNMFNLNFRLKFLVRPITDYNRIWSVYITTITCFRSELTAIMKGVSTLKHYRIPPVKVIGCARVKIVTRRRKSQTTWMVSNHLWMEYPKLHNSEVTFPILFP